MIKKTMRHDSLTRPEGRRACAMVVGLLLILALPVPCLAAEAQRLGPAGLRGQRASAPETPEQINININLGGSPARRLGDEEGGSGRMSDLMKIVIVLSVLTLVPAILLTMTSFTRIVIVLSFARRALSVQQMPPNQIVIGLSLFLTAFVMAPVFSKVNELAIQPSIKGEITEVEAIRRAEGPIREFMMKQTRKKDLALFMNIARLERPVTQDDVPTHILVPAFALSEIKTAFQMGFIVFLPMLVVDIVVATLLTSMGIFMLPPAMVSVPLKVLLFVLVDGWHLVIGSLAQSFM